MLHHEGHLEFQALDEGLGLLLDNIDLLLHLLGSAINHVGNGLSLCNDLSGFKKEWISSCICVLILRIGVYLLQVSCCTCLVLL